MKFDFLIEKYLTSIAPWFSTSTIRVHHGGGRTGVGGPVVKLARMNEFFPEQKLNYNIIYTVSASVGFEECIVAQKKGVKIVQHINSIYHPAYRANYEDLNRPFKDIYEISDYLVFGSDFAKRGSEKYFGRCRVSHSVIYNSLDISHYTPQKRPDNRFNILVIGSHYIRHRIEPLIYSMPYINRKYPNAKLVIAGPLKPGDGIFDCSKESFIKLAKDRGINNIEFIPQYTQEEAPDIYGKGDILVHLKHMDWTPNTVIEAMACELPVLYTGNGGVPEIVGEAGLSLGVPGDWDKILTPDSQTLAEAIIELYASRKEKGRIGRKIVEERYDINNWVSKHKEIFENLLK